MKYPNFIGPSYVSQSPIASGQELINWYVERVEAPGAKNPYVLYPTPGLLAFVTVDDTPGRALFEHGGRAWAVIGDGLYEVFENATATLRGAVARDQYPATLSANDVDQLFITSGDHGYVLDMLTNVLTEVLASGATMGESLSGYFIAFDIVTGAFRISGQDDGLTWDPTQKSGRVLAPDPWRSMLVVTGRLFLFGSKTSEVWGNDGGFPFPFSPITTEVIPYGIAAPFARARLQNTAAWLAQNEFGIGTILQTRGISPEAIQTEPIAWALSRYVTIADAQAWGYQDQGKPFLVFDFPTANATWVVDGLTGFWHQRGTWNIGTAAYNVWRPTAHAEAWGRHFVLDRNSGTIYQMDVTYGFDADGGPLRRLFRPPALCVEHQRLSISMLEVYLEAGLGLEVGQGEDPQILMRFSGNGGKTWGDSRARRAGRLGEYAHRAIWRRVGDGTDLQPEFVVSDPVPWRVIDGFVTIRQGRRARAA